MENIRIKGLFVESVMILACLLFVGVVFLGYTDSALVLGGSIAILLVVDSWLVYLYLGGWRGCGKK